MNAGIHFDYQSLLLPIVESVGWTLLHSIWQLGLLALFLKATLLLAAPDAARIRYRLALAALLLVIAMPVVTFIRILPAQKEQVARLSYPTEVSAAFDNSTIETYVAHEKHGSWSAIKPKNWENIQARSHEWREAFNSGKPIQVQSSDLIDVREQETRQSNYWPSVGTLAPNWADRLNVATPVIAFWWLLGVALFLLRPLFGFWHLGRLFRSAKVSQLSKSLQKRTDELANLLKLRRSVSIFESIAVEVPTVVGFFKPMILVPASAVSGLSVKELNTILLHELAHLKRRDDLVALLQTIIESLLFFHPAVWWISRVAHHERENCCDDIACEMEGSRSTLASALLKLAKADRRSTLALEATGGSLKARIQRMLSLAGGNDATSAPRSIASGTLVLIFAVTVSLTLYAGATEQPKSLLIQPAPTTEGPETDIGISSLSATTAIKNPLPDIGLLNVQTDGVSFSDAVKAFNRKHNRNTLGDHIEFSGIDPQPLTVEELEKALTRILKNEAVGVSEDLRSKLETVETSKRLTEDFSITATMGITPNDFTKITSWRIMLTYRVGDDRKSFRAFVIRDWGDQKNSATDLKKESAQLVDIGTRFSFAKPHKLSGQVTGVSKAQLSEAATVVDAITLFKHNDQTIAIIDTGEANVQADGSFDLSYGISNKDAKSLLEEQGSVVGDVLDFESLTRSTLIIARREGFFTRNLGTEIRDGTIEALDLELIPTSKIVGRAMLNGRQLENARVSLKGPDVDPAIHAIELVETDKEGKFVIDNVPSGFQFQLVIQPEEEEAGWASPPLPLVRGDSSATHLNYWPEGKQTEFSFQTLFLFLSGDAIAIEEAVASSAKKQLELKFDGLASKDSIVAGTASLEVANPAKSDRAVR